MLHDVAPSKSGHCPNPPKCRVTRHTDPIAAIESDRAPYAASWCLRRGHWPTYAKNPHLHPIGLLLASISPKTAFGLVYGVGHQKGILKKLKNAELRNGSFGPLGSSSVYRNLRMGAERGPFGGLGCRAAVLCRTHIKCWFLTYVIRGLF